ncbi:hypothetical protein M5D96_013661 [Drosophila gunungcola]|uniref:Uncharacterized protein n=1 Tax=Drosophila gunungcola TaxID=103775 RepID=A0A9P9YAU8_9MUSC|nr:hypothetical protein M5D96_013661 [Drosophila gunungcola]
MCKLNDCSMKIIKPPTEAWQPRQPQSCGGHWNLEQLTSSNRKNAVIRSSAGIRSGGSALLCIGRAVGPERQGTQLQSHQEANKLQKK